MQPIDFEGELAKILERDGRFDREAYIFLRQALDHCHRLTLKAARKKEAQQPAEKHVSVEQLLDGVRLYALQEYGPMATTVLESWGVRSCENFGEIVFNMVENRLLSVTENDTLEEFRKGYDFQAAFCAPFKPGKRGAPKAAIEPSAK